MNYNELTIQYFTFMVSKRNIYVYMYLFRLRFSLYDSGTVQGMESVNKCFFAILHLFFDFLQTIDSFCTVDSFFGKHKAYLAEINSGDLIKICFTNLGENEQTLNLNFIRIVYFLP